MHLKVLLLFFLFLFSEAQYEGERCNKEGVFGACMHINKCKSAVEDIKNRKYPQICSFDKADPIVCCVDTNTTPLNPIPGATTTRRPSVTTTTEYVPPVIFDDEIEYQDEQCESLPSLVTSQKTGQKAFDKCIEYQEKYVYPCGKVVALTGNRTRDNHCHHNAEELIIGGTERAAQFEFPHMVMLGYGDQIDRLQWLCGGAIISERFILTAGHCSASRDMSVTHVLIGAFRRSDAADKSKIYKVKNVIPHPEYRPPIKYNDIALLETEQTINLGQFTVPACIHTGDAVNENRVLATGWDLTQYSGKTSEILQKASLYKFTTSECAQKYPPVHLIKQGFNAQSQTCYGDKQLSKDTCQGDSGAPIQIKSNKIHCMYTIVGVTSFGRACGFVGEPGIFTRVANYVPWIESIVWP